MQFLSSFLYNFSTLLCFRQGRYFVQAVLRGGLQQKSSFPHGGFRGAAGTNPPLAAEYPEKSGTLCAQAFLSRQSGRFTGGQEEMAIVTQK